MGDDPTKLNDDEFARAFQQHTRGEDPTGKKWRPNWKTEPANAVSIAHVAIVDNINLFLEDEIGALPAYQDLTHGRVYTPNVAQGTFVAPYLSARARRILDPKALRTGVSSNDILGAWHSRRHFRARAEWRYQSGGPSTGVYFRRSTGNSSRLSIWSVNSRGGQEDLLIRFDLSVLYRLLRGAKEFNGMDLQARVAWAIEHTGEIFNAHDGTEYWELVHDDVVLGSLDHHLEWRGLDDEGDETRHVHLKVV